jgi:hypothetical protein
MRRALAAVAVLAAFATAASGCGLGPGEKTASEGSLTVTRDFGTEPIGRHNVAGVSQSDTVMRLDELHPDLLPTMGSFTEPGESAARGE